MQLVEDWDAVLKKAWSIKFSIAATIFGICEYVLGQLQPGVIPQGLVAGLGAVLSALGALFRLLQQEELSGAKDGTQQ